MLLCTQSFSVPDIKLVVATNVYKCDSLHTGTAILRYEHLLSKSKKTMILCTQPVLLFCPDYKYNTGIPLNQMLISCPSCPKVNFMQKMYKTQLST